MKAIFLMVLLCTAQQPSASSSNSKAINKFREIDKKEADDLLSLGASFDVQSQQIKRIVSCSLEGKSCGDKLFTTLQQCNSLEQVTLMDCTIDGDEIKKICHQRLKAIRIINCKISKGAIEAVLTAKGLKFVDLTGSIPDGFELTTAISDSITYINLSNNYIGEKYFSKLLHENINYLDLSFCDFENKKDLNKLSQVKGLKTLILSGINMETKHFNLSELSDIAIETVDLSRCNLSKEHISDLAKFKNILNLDISSNALDDSIFGYINKMKNIVYLNVSNNFITTNGINIISDLDSIATIVCKETSVTDLFYNNKIRKKLKDNFLKIILEDE